MVPCGDGDRIFACNACDDCDSLEIGVAGVTGIADLPSVSCRVCNLRPCRSAEADSGSVVRREGFVTTPTVSARLLHQQYLAPASQVQEEEPPPLSLLHSLSLPHPRPLAHSPPLPVSKEQVLDVQNT